MNISMGKMMPRAAALAVVGYCVWPTVADFMATPEIATPPKLPTVEAAFLSPVMPSEPTRDPFWDPNTPPPEKQIVKGTAKPVESVKVKQAKLSEKTAAIMSGLKLEATLVSGDRQSAVINGQEYSLKDTISGVDSGTSAFKVVDVAPYKVLLESGGRVFELNYSEGPAKTVAAEDD